MTAFSIPGASLKRPTHCLRLRQSVQPNSDTLVFSISKRQKTRKSRVQEVSRDRPRIIRTSLIAPKHRNKKKGFWSFHTPEEKSYRTLINSWARRLPGLLSFPDSIAPCDTRLCPILHVQSKKGTTDARQTTRAGAKQASAERPQWPWIDHCAFQDWAKVARGVSLQLRVVWSTPSINRAPKRTLSSYSYACASLCEAQLTENSDFLFPLQPPRPFPNKPPTFPPQRAWFRSVSGPFRSVSGESWGVGWGRGGVGERGFCKGKNITDLDPLLSAGFDLFRLSCPFFSAGLGAYPEERLAYICNSETSTSMSVSVIET